MGVKLYSGKNNIMCLSYEGNDNNNLTKEPEKVNIETTATEDDILDGKTALNGDGELIVGKLKKTKVVLPSILEYETYATLQAKTKNSITLQFNESECKDVFALIYAKKSGDEDYKFVGSTTGNNWSQYLIYRTNSYYETIASAKLMIQKENVLLVITGNGSYNKFSLKVFWSKNENQ